MSHRITVHFDIGGRWLSVRSVYGSEVEYWLNEKMRAYAEGDHEWCPALLIGQLWSYLTERGSPAHGTHTGFGGDTSAWSDERFLFVCNRVGAGLFWGWPGSGSVSDKQERYGLVCGGLAHPRGAEVTPDQFDRLLFDRLLAKVEAE